jgi:imidazolonepropionase-like amidohydrolase
MTDYWITGATVVDGTGRDPLHGTDLHIEDGRITGIGAAPAHAESLDLDGFTVTPGLIDAHTHLGISSDIGALMRRDLSVAEIAADIFANAAQTLDAGFTTVRDCGGIDGGLPAAIAAGRVRGPRIIPAGPIQCQTGGHGHMSSLWEPAELWDTRAIPGLVQFSMLSDGPDAMRRNVRESFRRGAKFVKLCVSGGVVSSHDDLDDTQLSLAEIEVAVEEARARGTYVTVHAHNNAGIRRAVQAGATCVEHGSSIDEETAALMAAAGVAHVPTLAVVEGILQGAEAMGLPPEIRDRAARMRQGQIDGLRASRAAGVVVGLGSDLIGPQQTGRAAELLLRARLETPMDALVAATRINAQVLRIADRVGTLEVGKSADLVAWRRDPLADPTVFTDRDQAALVVAGGSVVKDVR